MHSSRETFSVLICTYNRHELLRRALDSLLNAAGEKPDQIVVVNGGDERADDVVHRCNPLPNGAPIQLVRTRNKNLAASRNVGLPHCEGDIIAMTDDDAEVFPDWVTEMKRAHREHAEAGAVGGMVLGMETGSITGKVADLITFPCWPRSRHVRTLPGVNISYKRDAVTRVGPQDETLFRGEDVDYNWRVKRLGYEIYFDPAIRVYHHHRPSLRGLVRQQYMYGRAYFLVRRKWPEMYCVYPHHVRTVHDVMKAGNVLASLVYQPLLTSWRLPSWRARVSAAPLLFLTGLAWKYGMLVQAIAELAADAGGDPAPAAGQPEAQ